LPTPHSGRETDDKATSTGTTIVGVKFGGGASGEEEGVCLGADTRATGGSIVADKNCEKVSSTTLPLGDKLTLRSTTSLLRSGVVVLVPQLTLSKLALNSLKARADTQIRHQPHCFQPRATRSITRPTSTSRHRYDHAQAVPLPVSYSYLAHRRT
jgi:hypothetical protein